MTENKTESVEGMIDERINCEEIDESPDEECLLEEHPHPFKRKHSILTFVRTQSVSQVASRLNVLTLAELDEDHRDTETLNHPAENHSASTADVCSNVTAALPGCDNERNLRDRGRESPGKLSSRGQSPSPSLGYRTEPFAHQV